MGRLLDLHWNLIIAYKDSFITSAYQGKGSFAMRNQQPVLTCDEHGKEIDEMGEAIEHLRVKHVSFIRRPGRLGKTDTHGHYWYCFECGSGQKDHRSFNSDEAMWSHLKDRHSYTMFKSLA